MKKDYKLIALDMDGTLLNEDKIVTPVCLEAIKKASAAGKEVVLCSGRSPMELQEQLQYIPEVNYVVGGGTSYAVKEKKTIGLHPFSSELITELAEIMLQAGEQAVFILEAGPNAYTGEPQCNHPEDYLGSIYNNLFANHMFHTKDMMQTVLEHKDVAHKFSAYFQKNEDMLATRAKIKHLEDKITIVSSAQYDIETTSRGVSKADGLRDLSAYLNIPLDQMIMVGDNENDVEAMKIVGLPVAMGNAIPQVKAVAKAEVTDNEHDGVAEAIEKYLL